MDFTRDFKTPPLSTRNSLFSIEPSKFKQNTPNRNSVRIDKIQIQDAEDIESGFAVWTIGSGKEGALGNTQFKNLIKPSVIHRFVGIKVLQIACGAGHTYLMTDYHQIFSWGFNIVGQLGLGHYRSIASPAEITFFRSWKIIQIDSGAGHGLALDQGGNVFSWGSGGYYQTAHGDQQNLNLPKKCQKLSDIKQVSGGVGHSLFLSTDNQLWAVGSNEHGQCTGDELVCYIPKLIQFSDPIMQISAGGGHSLLLTQSNHVYACGLNNNGQLGNGSYASSREFQTVYLKNNSILCNVSKVQAGEETSLCLTQSGKAYSWGWNGAGQLGQKHFASMPFPVQMPICEAIQDISCGVSSNGLITESGDVFICGYIGDYSHLKRTSLDLNDKKFTNLSLAAPRKLLTEKHTAKLIQCGRSHCVIFGEKIGDTVYTHRESESEAEDTRAYFNFNRLKCTRIMLDDEEPSIDQSNPVQKVQQSQKQLEKLPEIKTDQMMNKSRINFQRRQKFRKKLNEQTKLYTLRNFSMQKPVKQEQEENTVQKQESRQQSRQSLDEYDIAQDNLSYLKQRLLRQIPSQVDQVETERYKQLIQECGQSIQSIQRQIIDLEYKSNSMQNKSKRTGGGFYFK